jgi:hypothetical protein
LYNISFYDNWRRLGGEIYIERDTPEKNKFFDVLISSTKGGGGEENGELITRSQASTTTGGGHGGGDGGGGSSNPLSLFDKFLGFLFSFLSGGIPDALRNK